MKEFLTCAVLPSESCSHICEVDQIQKCMAPFDEEFRVCRVLAIESRVTAKIGRVRGAAHHWDLMGTELQIRVMLRVLG